MRALLLDLGNVLVRFDHGLTLARIEAATGVCAEELRPALFGDLETSFDRGDLSSVEFFRAAEGRAGIPRLDDTVWIPAWRDIFEPIPEAIGLLDRLDRSVRTALVSNTNVLHWDGVGRVSNVGRRVDALALSFEVRALKPEPSIWLGVLECLGARPSEAVYADDRPELVEAARRLGIDAFTVESPASLADGLSRRGLLD